MLNILITRKFFTPVSTISEVFFDGQFMGYCLEDTDRGIDATMPLAEILSRKVHSLTAIPTGRYEVAITFSDRFQKYLPLLLNVPGYEGVRIHVGNFDRDTDGCLLAGLSRAVDFVGDSRQALATWLPLIQKAVKMGKVYLTITRDKLAWQRFQDSKQAVV